MSATENEAPRNGADRDRIWWILMSADMRMPWWAPAGVPAALVDPLADHVGLHASREDAEREIAEMQQDKAAELRMERGMEREEVGDDADEDDDPEDDLDVYAEPCRIDGSGDIHLLAGGGETMQVISRRDWYESFGMKLPSPAYSAPPEQAGGLDI